MSTTNPLHRALFVMTLAIFAAVQTGCVSDKQVIAQAADAHTGLAPAVITDQAIAQYIQQVGQRVVSVGHELSDQGVGPSSHKNGDTEWMFEGMEFHVVNSETLNAFTTGGKHMYIYSALIQQVADEDELAAVMAHEFAHVYCRHVQNGMKRQYTMLGLAAGAGIAGYAAGGKDNGMTYGGVAAAGTLAAGQFLGMGFTRKDEDQADQFGFNFYCHAGWDPNQFAGFFKKMIAAGYDKTPAYASDHPTLASRVVNTDRRIKELPPEAKNWRRAPVADAAKFAQIKARLAQIAKTAPNDKAVQKAKMMFAAFPSCVAQSETPEQLRAQQQVKADVEQIKKKK